MEDRWRGCVGPIPVMQVARGVSPLAKNVLQFGRGLFFFLVLSLDSKFVALASNISVDGEEAQPV